MSGPRQRTGNVRRKRRGEPDRRRRDNALKVGDWVRMTEAYKAKLQGACLPGYHLPPLLGDPPLDPDMPDDGCLHCSTAHVVEFGESVGVIEELADYNNCKPSDPAYDPNKVGPEFRVRWEPENLRYSYHPNDLERVRVPDAASAFCFMVEREMATLEQARLRRSTAKSDLKRFESIVQSDLEMCRAFANYQIARDARCPRVAKALETAAHNPVSK